MLRPLTLTAVALLIAGGAAAGDVKFSGSIGAELRVFPDDPQFSGQFTGAQASAIFNPTLSWQSDDGKHYAEIEPYLRLDSEDDERTHGDLRTAFYEYIGDDFEFLAGFNSVFWGVTESRHLVNVVNQIDAVENIDGEDYLGEPMISVTTQQDWGRLSLMVLPGFRERTFAGSDGRLRAPFPVDEDRATYDSSLEEASSDIALRYEHSVGEFDFGLSYFYGTGREPRLLPGTDPTSLVPHYDTINQVGLDVQMTHDAFLWKFEGIAREGQGDPFGAFVAGVEYTMFQVFDSSADLGLIAEALYDGRDPSAPATPFDNDVFLGARLAMNDVKDTSALLGAVIDLEDASTSLRFEAERRIGDDIKLELEAMTFLNIDASNTLAPLKDDHMLTVTLSRFF